MRKHLLAILLGLTVWAAVVGTGMKRLFDYACVAGRPGDVPARWPIQSAVPAPSDRPVLLVFVHPQCPCTQATLENLHRLMTRAQGRLRAEALFVKPASTAEAWVHTETWNRAARIGDVLRRVDDGGQEAARFGATVSGHVLVYGKHGDLVFSGGITESRGQAGDSAGLDALMSFVDRGGLATTTLDVYGCELLDAPPAAR